MGGKIESRKRLLQFRIFYMYVFVYQLAIVFDILETKRLRVSV